MKKCSEVMTKNPFCCEPNEMVTEAATLMKSKGIGSIPIVENGGANKLVGIVTDRDIVLNIVAEGRDPKTSKISDAMSKKVVTVKADDDVRKAIDAMAKHQLRRIPVVDKSNQLVGIIAQADVATRVNDAGKTASVVKEISQFARE